MRIDGTCSCGISTKLRFSCRRTSGHGRSWNPCGSRQGIPGRATFPNGRATATAQPTRHSIRTTQPAPLDHPSAADVCVGVASLLAERAYERSCESVRQRGDLGAAVRATGSQDEWFGLIEGVPDHVLPTVQRFVLIWLVNDLVATTA